MALARAVGYGLHSAPFCLQVARDLFFVRTLTAMKIASHANETMADVSIRGTLKQQGRSEKLGASLALGLFPCVVIRLIDERAAAIAH